MEPDNIIDLLPFLEGQKLGWTVDMTRAVLKHGTEECNRCLTHAREAMAQEMARPPINPYTGEVSALACLKGPIIFPEGMGDTICPTRPKS